MVTARKRSNAAAWLAVAGAAIVLAGCQAWRDRDAAIEVEATRYLGSPLTGPRPPSIGLAFDPAEPAGAHRVRVRLRHFESGEVVGMQPLSERLERIVEVRSDGGLLAASALTEASWIDRGDLARRWFESMASLDEKSIALGEFEHAVPTAVTFAVTATAAWTSPRAGAQSAALHLTNRGDGKLALALVCDGWILSPDPDEPELLPRNEVMVLQDALVPPKDGGEAEPLLIVVSFPDSAGGGSDAFLLEALPPPSDDAGIAALREDLASCVDEVARSSERALAAGEPIDPFKGLSALPAHARRGALARLSIVTGAALTEAFAGVVDDAGLDEYAVRLGDPKNRPSDAPPSDGRIDPLILDRATLRYLSERLALPDPPPPLVAILLDRYGEAGRYPGALEGFAAGIKDPAAFDAMVVEQNKSFLEDRSVAARCRAFEWLVRRNAAPSGYDPLADAKSRRAALRAAESAAATESP